MIGVMYIGWPGRGVGMNLAFFLHEMLSVMDGNDTHVKGDGEGIGASLNDWILFGSMYPCPGLDQNQQI